MKQPPHIEYGTPEFWALRPQIDALIEKRHEAAKAIAAALNEAEREPHKKEYRELQKQINALAAQVWVSYKTFLYINDFNPLQTRIL